MNKTILVTGGAGYIGSHTAVELIKNNYQVIIVDDLSNSSLAVLDKIETIAKVRPKFYQENVCDKGKVDQIFQENKIDGVIHFAASKAVGESVSNPLKYYTNNLTSLINILGAMGENKVSSIVFSSSCTVYGQAEKLPVTEQTPFQKSESPYGNTKQIGEEILRDFVNSDDRMKSIALRYFNPVGAHESGLIGELPIGVPNNLIPYVSQTAAGIREQLSIFGDDYDTPDGTAIRDFIHVVDLAKAHVIAVDRQLTGMSKSNFEYFNLGTGNGYSVLEIIQTFEKVNGIKVNYKIVDRREGDIEKIYADTSFANNELGWKAELGLDQMMKSVWNWQKNLN